MCIFLPDPIYEDMICNNIKLNKHDYLFRGREGPSSFILIRTGIDSS